MTKKRARDRLRAMSATMWGQWGYTTIAGGIFCRIWDMEGQDSEHSRGVTWQLQQALGSLVSWRIAGWSTGPGAYCAYFTYYLLNCILWYNWYCLHINSFNAYIRIMTGSLARDRVYVIAVMQKGMIFCRIWMFNWKQPQSKKGEGRLKKHRRLRSTTEEIMWCWLSINHLWCQWWILP